jgi:spore coat protein U-like protein
MVQTVGVAFGNYDPISGQSLDGVGSVRVQCTPAVGYVISLSAGNGSYANRELQSGLVTLFYNLYSNASRSLVWGDGSGATVTVSGMGEDDTHNVYGRIAGGQIQASAGSYADLIVVTVEF